MLEFSYRILKPNLDITFKIDPKDYDHIKTPLFRDIKFYEHKIPYTHYQDFSNKLQCFISDHFENNINLSIVESTYDIDENSLDSTMDILVEQHAEETEKEKSEQQFVNKYKKIIDSNHSIHAVKKEIQMASEVLKKIKFYYQRLDDLNEENILKTDYEICLGDMSVSEISKIQKNHAARIESFKQHEKEILSNLKELQTRQFRDFVKNFNLEGHSVTSLDTSNPIPAKIFSSEAFTVQVGRNQKTTCNIRLIESEIFYNLTQLKQFNKEISVCSCAEKFNLNFSLYNNLLEGVILFVESLEISKKIISRFCDSSTEVHFEPLEDQYQEIKDLFQKRGGKPCKGDIFISRHSNLESFGKYILGDGVNCAISVVFHVILHQNDVYLQSTSEYSKKEIINGIIQPGSINIPNYLISALTVIFKLCFQRAIVTITLPIILTHVFKPDKETVIRRSEFLLKVLKNILIELNTWQGNALKNIQLVIPKIQETSHLQEFSVLLSRSFRSTKPIMERK